MNGTAKTKLGATGPEVFPIALGCMGMSGMYGASTDAEGIATIQEAVDAATAGDTILIAEGDYVEDLSITKGITLQAVGEVTLTAASPVPGTAITISGGWQALVLMQFSDVAATQVAHRMLGMGPDEQPVAEDLSDSLGELVNVIGGNVKSLMPGPSQLSLPLVAQGTVTASVPGPAELVETTRLDLRWLDQPVRLSISAAAAEVDLAR